MSETLIDVAEPVVAEPVGASGVPRVVRVTVRVAALEYAVVVVPFLLLVAPILYCLALSPITKVAVV